MAKSISTRDRLLKLIDLLKNLTDEEHELSVTEIIELISQEYKEPITISQKAVLDDLKALDANQFDITENESLHGKRMYSHQYRLFDLYELRILVDAISSARFITSRETENIINKIKKLTSKHNANNLNTQLYYNEHFKSKTNQVRIYIDQIHQAIADNRWITFKYGRYNVDKEFVLSRNGYTYEIGPYALFWHSDYYYLIGKNKRGQIRHYRVDRIQNVEVINEKVEGDNQFDLSEYTKTLFNMYTGNVKEIEVEFDHQLINVVIDKFGKEVNIEKGSDDLFLLKTKATISDGLVRWLLTWGSDARVVSPPSLVEKLKEETNKMFTLYN